MHRSKLSSGALLAVGLAGLLAADASVARADGPGPGAEAGVEIGPMDVTVGFGAGVDIKSDSRQELDDLAVWLKEDPNRIVYIQTHPDAMASPGMDIQLRDRRAEEVKSYLVQRGVTENQVRVVPHGQTPPEATGVEMRTVFIAMEAEAQAEMGEPSETELEPGAGVGVGEEGAGAEVGGDVNVRVEEDEEPYATTPPPPVVAPGEEPEAEREEDRPMFTPMGMSLAVGGGVIGFIDSDARSFTDTGGSWEARLSVGTRWPVSIEAAYVGSAQDVEALGLDNDAILLGTLLEASARLNILPNLPVQPYLFGGVGYTRYDITNEDFNTSAVDDEESLGHIPVGAGFGFRYLGLMFDVRGTYRATWNDDLLNQEAIAEDPDLIPDGGDPEAELDTWNVTARVGWEF